MVFQTTGMNLTNLGNITQLNLTTTLTTENIIESAISTLNNDAGLWVIGLILATLYVIIMWALTDSSPFGDFKYSYLRGSALALSIVNLLSITMLEIGIITSFRIVAIFFILNILNTILVLSLDN